MPKHAIPSVEGIITSTEISATVAAIASVQLPDGNIPWSPGDHTDPWNLVEAAMALDVGGRHDEAVRAYEWLRTHQHDAGCWHAYYVGNNVKDPATDTNVTCYLANGAWHHYLTTGDTAFLEDFWPSVERGIDFALSLQAETGEIAWRGDERAPGALLTGCSSMHASLRWARAMAPRRRPQRPPGGGSHGRPAHAGAPPPGAVHENSGGGSGL
jgi:hypothetical protein